MNNRDDRHWTERSPGSYQFLVAFDFVNQLDEQLAERGFRRADLARKMGVTEGRISQIFNNPRGLNLQTIIRLARAAGLKVSVVTYDDHDPENKHGPIESRVFRLCWERAGRPREAWELLSGEERPGSSVGSGPTWQRTVEDPPGTPPALWLGGEMPFTKRGRALHGAEGLICFATRENDYALAS